MAISLVAVGAKITAAITNTIIGALNAAGLTQVVPTSVAGTGVSVSTAGTITFSAATVVNVNGCFTSGYDNYRVVFEIASSSVAAGGSIRLRSAGADDASASYSTQQFWVSGSTVSGNNSSAAASWGAVPVAGIDSSAIWEFFAPALVRATRLQIRASMWASAAAGVDSSTSGRHSALAPFDGFTFTPSAGNVTGTIRIYGYNNG